MRVKRLVALTLAVLLLATVFSDVCTVYGYYDEDEGIDTGQDGEDPGVDDGDEQIDEGDLDEGDFSAEDSDEEDIKDPDEASEVLIIDGEKGSVAGVFDNQASWGKYASEISLNSRIEIVELGQSCQLTSRIYPSTADLSGMRWISNNEAVATVSGEGKVNAKGLGTAKVLLIDTNTGRYDACNIVVSEKTVFIDSIHFSEKKRSMEAGDATTLHAKVVPADASAQKLSWSSSKPSVASVDSTGYVTAHKAGTTIITARAQDGKGANASMELTVKKKNIKVMALDLLPVSVSMEEGASRTLKVQVSPANATNRKVIWTSSNPRVVTVNQAGKLRAKKTGTAKITIKAKDGSGVKAVCKITVKRKVVYVTKISLSASKKELEVGKSCTLTAQTKPVKATNKKVHWFSSNPDVASVNKKGVVKAKKEGIAVIRAVAADGSGKQAACNVSVRGANTQNPIPTKPVTPTPAKPISVQKPKIQAPSSYAQEGKTITLTTNVRGGQWSYLKKSGLVYIHTEGTVCKVTGISKGEVVIRYTLNGQVASTKIYVIP